MMNQWVFTSFENGKMRHPNEISLFLLRAMSAEESWFTISFARPSAMTRPEVTPEATPQVERLAGVLAGEMTRADLMAALSLKDRMHFSQEYLQPTLELGLIEMTLPDKPRSSRQKYRLTEKGRKLAEMKKE